MSSTRVQIPETAAKTTSVTPTALDPLRQRRQDFKNDADSLIPVSRPTGYGHRFSQVQVRNATLPRIQTKLTVNEPGDKYEQEADRVADEVMRMPKLASPEDTDFLETASGPRIQRKCAECVEEELQAKESPGETPVVTSGIQARIDSMRGGGEPLSESLRALYEPRIGADFAGTRIHTGSLAIETSRSLKSRAFTLGSDIFFNSGEFQPDTASGKRLLAHELTHVVQQTKSDTRPPQKANREASRTNRLAKFPNGSATSSSRRQQLQLATPGIMRISPDRFQERVGRTKEQKIVVRQLFDHPKFKRLWNWLGNCECDRADLGPIRLRVRPTFGDGVQTFGDFDQSRGILTINPNIRAARKNPQELVDTIVHEVVHAISWAWRNGLCPGQQSPLQQLDIIGASKGDMSVLQKLQLRKPPCKRTRFPVAEPPKSLTLSNVEGGLSELEQFERSGPSASDPCTTFQDLREQPQQKIIEIVDDIQRQTGIGSPTRTLVNQILREDLRRAQQTASSFYGILEQAPQLRGFMQCRDEECVKPRRRRDIERCFNEVLERAPVQSKGGDGEGLQSQPIEQMGQVNEVVQRAAEFTVNAQSEEVPFKRSIRRWARRVQRLGLLERWTKRLEAGQSFALRRFRTHRARGVLRLVAQESDLADELKSDFLDQLVRFLQAVDGHTEEDGHIEEELASEEEPNAGSKTPAQVRTEELNLAETQAADDPRRGSIPIDSCAQLKLLWQNFKSHNKRAPNGNVAFTKVNFKEINGNVSASFNSGDSWAWKVLKQDKDFPACKGIKKECEAISEGKQATVSFNSEFCTGTVAETVDRDECLPLIEQCQKYQLAERARLLNHEQGHLDISCVIATLVNEKVKASKRLYVADKTFDAVVDEYDGTGGAFGTKSGCFREAQGVWANPAFVWRRVEKHLKDNL